MKTCSFCPLVRFVATSALALTLGSGTALSETRTTTVVPNDNRQPAGTLAENTLRLSLRAGLGSWQPEGPAGPSLTIEALGEISQSLTVPAPLIRVPEGTTIAASIRNDLDVPLLVHGFCTRNGESCPPVSVPARETGRIQFAAGRAGTYHYWATTLGAPVPFRELAGAFIVDPPATVSADDRIFVITEWSSLTPSQLGSVFNADDPGKAFVALKPQATFVINGLSWPATERLSYQLGETARWRVINLSSQVHPMHLHGFYFEVESLGDGVRDRSIAAADRHPVVTHVLPPSTNMVMNWTPEREGNWLFHCHIMHHVSPERRISEPDASAAHEHSGHDRSGGMAGMIIGVTVVSPSTAPRIETTGSKNARKLTLVMARNAAAGDPSLGFALSGDGLPNAPADVSTPGPPLVLRRGEPVEISVVNRLDEPTALHWHGMELDSYYDGVHNWSGVGKRVAPMIAPGKTFVVRFTPPRAGTFMYHTHLHDERQLPLGLYGPMLVLEPGEAYDPSVDHTLIVGRHGLDPAAPNVFIPQTPMVINGQRSPVFVWKAGSRHRIRLINITPDDIVSVTLQTSKGPATWTPVTKDGSPLPAVARRAGPAIQAIAVGETYDFEVDLPAGRQTVWIEVRSPAGKWEAQAQAIVR